MSDAAASFWHANARTKRDAVLPMFSRIATNIVSNPSEQKFRQIKQSFFLSKTEGVSLAGELMLALGFQLVEDMWIFFEQDTSALQAFIAGIADLQAADQAQLDEQRAKIARDHQCAALALDREKQAKQAAMRAKEDIAKKERAQQQSLCPAQASIAAPMSFGTRGEVVVKAKGG